MRDKERPSSWHITADKVQEFRQSRQDERRLTHARRVIQYIFTFLWPLFFLFLMICVGYVAFRWAFL